MRLRTQRSTRTDTLLPDTTLFRSWRDPPSGHQVRSCHFSLTGKAPHPHFTTERGHQTRYVMNRMPVATSLPPLVHPMRAWCPIVDPARESASRFGGLGCCKRSAGRRERKSGGEGKGVGGRVNNG